LFHDTDAALSIDDIRKALYQLSNLHQLDDEQTADTAIAVRVNDNTIAATFSMRALPKPTKVHSPYSWNKPNTEVEEWLSNQKMRGWIVPAVKNGGVPINEIGFADFYEDCEQLPRLMGMCPCPMQDTGECARTLVWSKLPEAFHAPEVQQSFFDINNKVFNRVAYKAVGGFEYVSSSCTTSEDFMEGLRPWDNHDFSNVPDRKKELSSRGKERHIQASSRKSKCAECAFATKKTVHRSLKDCGFLDSCAEGVTDNQGWVALYAWLDRDSGFMNMPGFTTAQRNYLLRLSGEKITARVLYESRQTKTVYGGFLYKHGEWTYTLAAAAGDLSRVKRFNTYQELQQALQAGGAPLADAPEDAPAINRRTLLACALLGYHTRATQPYQAYHPTRTVIAHNIDATGDTQPHVVLEAASHNYINVRLSVTQYTTLSEFVRYHPVWTYAHVNAFYKKYRAEDADAAAGLAATASKHFLPVIRE
jgi:hypothetical protein